MEAQDDGRLRTGTTWTATAHAITAIIGSGVLTLPWSVAQLGWIIGPLVLISFAIVTYYTAIILSDCYRFPGPINGRRNYTYMDVVRAFLGARDVFICGIMQYMLLWGAMVGYTITAAVSMAAVKRSNCFHAKGHDARCGVSGNLLMLIFGAMEIILSQFPSLEKVTLLSVVAAATSFIYSFASLYLCIVKFASQHKFRGSLVAVKMGNDTTSIMIWNAFQALGNIAFAYTYAMLLIEIQDTLKSPPPENKTMKKVTMFSTGLTTFFYVSLGCIGYLAFGNEAPGNVLTGFYEPFWLVDIANLAVIIHLITAYQVFAQPIFAAYEKRLASKWPTSRFFNKVNAVKFPWTKAPTFEFTLASLLLRPVFVLFTTIVAMMFPFFNAIVGLLGSLGFWPLTVYFPVSMHIQQAKIKRGTPKWMILQSLIIICLVVAILGTVGSFADIIQRLKHAKLFDIAL